MHLSHYHDYHILIADHCCKQSERLGVPSVTHGDRSESIIIMYYCMLREVLSIPLAAARNEVTQRTHVLPRVLGDQGKETRKRFASRSLSPVNSSVLGNERSNF